MQAVNNKVTDQPLQMYIWSGLAYMKKISGG